MNTIRWVLVALSLFSGMLTAQQLPANQPGDTTFTSELTGFTIDLGTTGDAVFEPDGHQMTEDALGEQEDIQIQLGHTTIYLAFLTGNTTPASWEADSTELFAGTYFSYEYLGDDIQNDQSWSLYRANYALQFTELQYSEYIMNAFGEFHYAVVVYSTEEMMLNDLEWIATNITVDGAPLPSLADATVIQQAINGEGGYSPRVLTSTDDLASQRREDGLESSRSWTGPQTETSISWTPNWLLPPTLRNAVDINYQSGRDRVLIITPDHSGEAWISVYEQTPEYDSVQEWFDLWTSDDWIEGFAPFYTFDVHDTVITDSYASVIFLGVAKYGDPVVIIYTVSFPDDGPAVVSSLRATPGSVADVYQRYLTGVTVAGKEAPAPWTVEEIKALPAN